MAPERLCDRLQEEGGISESGETDPENAVPVVGDERPRRLEREPCLARAAGAGQRHQPGAVSQQRDDLGHLALRPMKELAGCGRFVFEIVFSGGKRTRPSW